MFLARCAALVLALVAGLAAPAAAQSLAGSEWVLVELNGERVSAEPRPVIRFPREGVVDGFGGCNRFIGRYSTGPAKTVALPPDVIADPAARAVEGPIDFSRVAATKMACPGVIALETRFFGMLERTKRFQHAAVLLTLKGSDGTPTATYSLTFYDAENTSIARFAPRDRE